MKKVKAGRSGSAEDRAFEVEEDGKFEKRRKSSYRNKMMGLNMDVLLEDDDADLVRDVSGDDEIEDDDQEGSWISMGITKEEKKEAR